MDYGSHWYLNYSLPGVRSDYEQNVTATQVRPVTEYTVRYTHWIGSVAVTYAIILVLLPTFWGFWKLAWRTSMSPVDMARALQAPLLAGTKGDTSEVLHEFGQRNIHVDLKRQEAESTQQIGPRFAREKLHVAVDAVIDGYAR